MNRIDILNWGIAPFIADPRKRCVDDEGGCFYSETNGNPLSNGCFIGQFLSKADRIKADGTNSTVNGLIRRAHILKIKLPKWMSEDNSDFLTGCQNLHDNIAYWTDKGLSKAGIERLERIKKEFC